MYKKQLIDIKRIAITLTVLFALLLNMRCRKPYILPASSSTGNALVVEALINTGYSPTTIKLSRTVKLTDTVNFLPELGATVTIENNATADGAVVLYTADNGDGNYVAYAAGLDPAYRYRVRIVTSAGETYLSDFVPIKNAPPIDSLSYQVSADGIHIFSDSHDPTNNTRYYRWDYTETWIIHSKYPSSFEVQTTPTDTIIPRPPKDQIYTCWQNDASTTVILNSSAKLSQDIIAHNAIAIVGSNSEKLGIEYSITVTQYALTPDAFNYWQNLKLINEQLGSIFDAQPSQIQGNVHSVTNPSEEVKGYVTAGSSTQQTLFVGASSLPQDWFRTISLPYDGCLTDTDYYANNSVGQLFRGIGVPIEAIITPHEVVIGYSTSSPFCVDCRLRGTNVRPSFWIDKF